jgi:glycosyltransferase involved in cell wall biosynthesis
MKVLYFTAGAAGMYCGSCLRDNALATELRSRGVDIVLVPLYTPTLTDEPNVSHGRVFFGGISVYLQQHLWLFRRTPWLFDRLWDSKPVLAAASRGSIPTSPAQLGELTVSMLRGENGFQRKELDKLLYWLASERPPDVIDLQNSLLLGLAGPLKRTLKRPVCCTLQGEDLFLEGLPESYRRQAIDLIGSNLEFVDAFITVSEYYRNFMIDYLRLPPLKTHVVPLGIKAEDFVAVDVTQRGTDPPFTVGYFARVAPEKGLHVLAEAYIDLRRTQRLPVSRLEAGGYLAPENRTYLERIQQSLADAGLAGEFMYRGALDRAGKLQFFRRLHVFSVPGPYAEPKGLPILEAMATGIPVVQPRRGAFPELIEKTGGGVLVGDGPGELSEGLLSIWRDPVFASALGQRGARGVRRHYTVGHMADRALAVYESVASRRAPSTQLPNSAPAC